MIQQDTMEQITKFHGDQSLPYGIPWKTAGTNGCATTEDTALLSQIAWLNCQYFGRRSEKLVAMNPCHLSLFDSVPEIEQDGNIREEGISVAVPSKTKPDEKKKRSRRTPELMAGLHVVEVVIELDRVDLVHYRRIGEERTRILEFEPNRLYVM